MKSKKFVAVALAAITMGTMAAFASCGSDGDSTGSTAEKVTLSFAGSTSVQPLMGALADAYMKEHKNVEIEVQGGGSAVGISNAQEGKGDFGMASKHVDEEGVTSVKIADDGIVVIVNKESEHSFTICIQRARQSEARHCLLRGRKAREREMLSRNL